MGQLLIIPESKKKKQLLAIRRNLEIVERIQDKVICSYQIIQKDVLPLLNCLNEGLNELALDVKGGAWADELKDGANALAVSSEDIATNIQQLMAAYGVLLLGAEKAKERYPSELQ